jgi:hypothetical protein
MSVTEIQLEANRANSTLSTGPRTPDGKEIASRNSLKHGLTSQQVVLPWEHPEEFAAVELSLSAEYKPITEQETRQLQQVAQNFWRLQRCRRMESQMFINSMYAPAPGLQLDEIDENECLNNIFNANGKEFDRLRRYETTIERSYYKSIKVLEEMQKARRAQEEKILAAQSNGSVPQKSRRATKQMGKTGSGLSEEQTNSPDMRAKESDEERFLGFFATMAVEEQSKERVTEKAEALEEPVAVREQSEAPLTEK